MVKKNHFGHFFLAKKGRKNHLFLYNFFLVNRWSVWADFWHGYEQLWKECHKFYILVVWPLFWPKMARKGQKSVFFFIIFIFWLFFSLKCFSIWADLCHSDENSCTLILNSRDFTPQKGQKGPKNRQKMQKSGSLTLWSKFMY